MMLEIYDTKFLLFCNRTNALQNTKRKKKQKRLYNPPEFLFLLNVRTNDKNI